MTISVFKTTNTSGSNSGNSNNADVVGNAPESLNTLEEIAAALPWTMTQTDHQGWGGNIYLLQTRGDDFRIRRIDADGNTAIAQIDPGVTADGAWADRETLTYT